jgi:hypothetical protein
VGNSCSLRSSGRRGTRRPREKSLVGVVVAAAVVTVMAMTVAAGVGTLDLDHVKGGKSLVGQMGR